MKLYKMIVVMLLLSMMSTLHAFAGSFKLYPTRIDLSVTQKTDTLQISSSSEKTITLQLKAREWDQDEMGKDIYRPAKDLVFFPQIFKIEPEEERIIRIGSRTPPGNEEKAYRLFVEELPEAGLPAANTLNIVLKMSIPVFIAPVAKSSKQGDIVGVAMQNGALAVRVENKGNSHFFVDSVKAAGKDKSDAEVSFPENRGWYLLSRNTADYSLGIDKLKCNELKELKVSIASDSFDKERQFPIDAETCKN